MSRVWTVSQRQAIDASGGSLIVSAAAGSGKTAVLVERVISRIIDEENPIDADRILVVTYTRAAASELKERLKNKLSQLIKNDPYNKTLLRQQMLINKAKISTIDSFCSSLVKEYFYALNIDRNFRIADESELMLMKKDALKLTLDSMYADGEPDFFRLVEAFSSVKDDSKLQEVILKIHEFLRSHPYPKWWIDEKLEMFTQFDSVNESVWYSILLDYAKDATVFLDTLLDSSFNLLDLDKYIGEKITPIISNDADFLDKLKLSIEHPKKYSIKEVLDSYVAGSFPRMPGYTDHPVKVKLHNNRKAFVAAIKKLKQIFCFSQDECKQHIAELFVLSTQLLNCVSEFSNNFQKIKAIKKVADYSDLEHWTIKLLVDEKTREFTDIAKKLSGEFDEIMVDEYQDANETQDLIFSALSKNNENLFFVGDVKQSIYGFRQAMPQLFLDRKNNSELYTEDKPVFPAKIFLDKNFRSIKGVTEIVNFFFEKLMSKSVGDIEYNDTESLKCGAVYDEESSPTVEYHLLDYSDVEDADCSVIEATHIAQMIQKMVFEGYMVKDGDRYRKVTYGDFAVLMRKKTESPMYVDTLISCGVPAYCETSSGFIEAPEIATMIDFLSVIDNPALDIELLSVMMSPIFGFTADDLADIRSDSIYSSLYRAVVLKAQSGNSKCRHFIDELSYYRDICVTTSVHDLINTIYERTSYTSIVSAVNDNSLAVNNLLLLKEYAKNFESGSSKGLSGFVLYLSRLRENKSDIKGAIDISTSQSNTVKVMSIHASKGLEFPVCIVANTARKFSTDTTDEVLLHSEFGIAVKQKDIETNVSNNTMPRQALSLAVKRDEMSEELRVLYVAMTRAKQKLVLISSHKSADKYLKGIASKLSDSGAIMPYIVRNCTYLCEWITMCVMIHPDGEKLREIADCDVQPDTSVGSSVDVKVVYINQQNEDENLAENVCKNIESDTDEGITKTLSSRSSYKYKNKHLDKLPSKISASELSHKLSTKTFERILDTPAFMSDSTLTAAQKGTALHAFMQFCDFSTARIDIESEIERLCAQGYISKVQADSINREKAKAFISSDIITHCLESDRVFKEYRFTIKVDASVVDPDISPEHSKEQIILQGAVDLAFVEDGELVIVDYKTDRVNDVKLLYDMYHNQLEIYADAMQQCTDYKVKESLIYSIHLNEYIYI